MVGLRRAVLATDPLPLSSSSRARSTSGEVEPAEAADVAHPALGEPVGGLGGRDRVGPGQLEDGLGRVVDPARALLGPLEAEALELVGHLDQAAGVHAVVGRVEDPAVRERLLDARVGQLVVGGAADDLGGQHVDHLVGQRVAHRARRVDVDLRAHQRVGVGDRGRAVLASPSARPPAGRRRSPPMGNRCSIVFPKIFI